MIRTFDGLEVDTIEPIPAHNLSAQTTDLAHGGYWNCELAGGGCVQRFGDELLVNPDASIVPWPSPADPQSPVTSTE